MDTERIFNLIFVIPSILIALPFHEFSHGWMAFRLGDPTAKYQGRLTLNILSHLDPFGTILLIVTALSGGPVFGWAKPVPVNPYNFRDPKKGILLTALAGPFSNIFLAFLSGFFIKYGLISGGFFGQFLLVLCSVNISLAIFNLIPIPPLDGSKILSALLPPDLSSRYESAFFNPFISIFIFAIIILTPIFDFIILPLYRLLLGLTAGI